MSTYSNLKFELIGTGDQAGTWGATTNTNIGTAIEQAIAGMATLATGDFSSNVATLTLIDSNVAQNARAVCLNITATLTGAGTVNVPAIQKTYLVINNSVGGFAVTVKVSGQTGVSIPNGKSMWVYNNGTDVIAAVNYLSSLSLGSALPVASGGTGATTAANARTNLGSTTVGDNLFTLTNPSAITFPRFNANNTVTALNAADFRTAIGAGTGDGTVTSVSGTSPVASSGGATPAISLNNGYGDTKNPYGNKTANYFLAAPNGSAGAPSFRSIVSADLPFPITLDNATFGSAITLNNSSSTLTQYNTIDFYKTATPAAGTVYISGITASSKDTLGVNALAGQLLFAASTSGTISGIAYLDTVLSGVRNTRLATGLTEMTYYSAASGSYGTHFTANSTRIGPGFDNALSAGSSSYRYSVVYAATGTINTSDINEKEQIQSLDDAEQRAAKAIKGLIKKFKWKDAVAKKGNAARIHVGVIAQEVEAVFLAEGLDPNRYGLFCKDVWWEKMDTDGLPGDEQALPVLKRFETEVKGGIRKERKGIRYDQLLAFVIAAV